MEETSEELLEVKVIRYKGQAALVESDLTRVSVPRDEVLEESDGKTYVSAEMFDMGIPHGIPFESELPESFRITGADIARELHLAGIWTVEDFDANPRAIQSVVLSACKNILADINGIVRNYKRRRNNS